MTLQNTLQNWVTIGVTAFATIKKLRFRKLLPWLSHHFCHKQEGRGSGLLAKPQGKYQSYCLQSKLPCHHPHPQTRYHTPNIGPPMTEFPKSLIGHLTGCSLNHLQNSSKRDWEIEFSLKIICSILLLSAFCFPFSASWKGLGWMLNKPIPEIDLEREKSDDSQRSLSGDLCGEWGPSGGLLTSARWLRDGQPKGRGKKRECY